MIARRLLVLTTSLFLFAAYAGADDVIVSDPGPMAAPGCSASGCAGNRLAGCNNGGGYDPLCGSGHCIWGYLPPYPASHGRYGIGGDVVPQAQTPPPPTGKIYKGRAELSPAVPYSDYLKDLRGRTDLLAPSGVPAVGADRALLEVRLPADGARVWFNKQELTGQGRNRFFQTPTLAAGQMYRFTVKAEWPGVLGDLGGAPVAFEQIVDFRAGEHKTIEFKQKN